MLAISFIKAVDCQKDHTSPWSIVSGPAAATVASLSRLGWKAISPFKWSLPNGFEIDVNEFSAKDVEKLALPAARDFLWRQAAEKRKAYEDLTSTPFLQPVQSFCGKRIQRNGALNTRVCCAVYLPTRGRTKGPALFAATNGQYGIPFTTAPP